jgi:hypothetical protein
MDAASGAESKLTLKQMRPVMKKMVLATLGVVAITSASAQTPPAKPDEKTLSDAYTYLLGRALVFRQEQMDRRGAGSAYNAIKYNPLGSADFVNPNFDVAYFEAWFAVDDRTPVLLEIPEVKDRYYTAQILDEWGEVIVNINERTFPSKSFGKFALVKPEYRAPFQLMQPASNCIPARPRCWAAWRSKAIPTALSGFSSSSRPRR